MMTTYEIHKMQVEEIKKGVERILNADTGTLQFSDLTMDYDIDACEDAAALGGYDYTLCKLFNKYYREAFFNQAFEMAKERAMRKWR